MTQHAAAFGGFDTESDALPPDHPTTLFHYAKRLSSMYMVLYVVLHDSWVKMSMSSFDTAVNTTNRSVNSISFGV